MWAAVAVLCAVAGAAGSVLGAHAVASHDDAQAKQAFHLSVSSTGIASTAKVAIQHEEDLVDAASTFFAGHPKASPAEFSAWARWTGVLRRYPELQRLGFVASCEHRNRPRSKRSSPPCAEPAGLTNRSARLPPEASARSPRPRRATTASRPSNYPGARGRPQPRGSAIAALTPGLLSSRDSARASYPRLGREQGRGLGVEAPVYKGGVAFLEPGPQRRHSSAGCARCSCPGDRAATGAAWPPGRRGAPPLQGRLLECRLQRAAPRSQSARAWTTNLHNGWTVRSFGPPAAGASLFADGNALALMIAGVLLSVLIGLLVFFLGTRGPRARAAAPVGRELPQEELYDALTGLPNRALMLDRAERMLARAGRQSGMLVGALFIDIDWFRDVNDKIGEAAGDSSWGSSPNGSRAWCEHRTPWAGSAGDEFVVLVESAARGCEARLAGPADDRSPAQAGRARQISAQASSSTASIGVAFGRYATADDLLRDAPPGDDRGQGRGQGSLHALQRQHALGHREPALCSRLS